MIQSKFQILYEATRNEMKRMKEQLNQMSDAKKMQQVVNQELEEARKTKKSY